MKFQIPSKKTGYYPEVISLLKNMECSNAGHSELGLNHPADVFYFSFLEVIDSAKRLLERLRSDALKRKESYAYTPDNLEDYRVDIFNLIFFSANFIEACQSILKSVLHKDERFTKASREFKDLTSSYRAHVSKIINEVKHKHRRVRPFSSSWDANLVVGYYIEGVLPGGTLGADPLIHDDFHGMKTGFSLNRNIPYHLINTYFVSSALSSVLVKYSGLNSSKCNNFSSDEIKKCFDMLSDLPLLFFPDEIEMKVPSIKRNKAEGFSLELPSGRKIENRRPHIMNISLSQRIGLQARSFSLPYFRG
ncbi:hypothetical protein EGC79_20335 [Shewanella vesiculosa]|uniref:hypothetical protein n=1 Tax=Shewanella vesiculosa TaxID=518738 RepID=UPI000F5071B1|nr:hypothetical protein [Shewanella vesiculosa]RPA33624.1 hypothetical protein EGC79_20335 [Shewanella vesiculosa]UJL43897.1 hypothetical protein KDH10_001272 [Shewanella vesiculosa]